MAHFQKQRHRSAIDLEEIAPNRFLIHNPRMQPLLKDEGLVDGRMFEMTTWRREGLVARLRERSFHVRLIADRLEALPEPPEPPVIGGSGWRPLASAIEHFSNFDLRRMQWHPLTPETRAGTAGLTIYEGWVLRRRKGRGSAAYYLAFKERGGGIGLRSLDETNALLIGYAQAIEHDSRPLLALRRSVKAGPAERDMLLLPNIELPPAYRAILEQIAQTSPDGPLVDARGWPVAQNLYGRLGLRLTAEPA